MTSRSISVCMAAASLPVMTTTSSIFLVPQATFEKLESELREVNSNAETLRRNSLELTELMHVLKATQLFFDEVSAPWFTLTKDKNKKGICSIHVQELNDFSLYNFS